MLEEGIIVMYSMSVKGLSLLKWTHKKIPQERFSMQRNYSELLSDVQLTHLVFKVGRMHENNNFIKQVSSCSKPPHWKVKRITGHHGEVQDMIIV